MEITKHHAELVGMLKEKPYLKRHLQDSLDIYECSRVEVNWMLRGLEEIDDLIQTNQLIFTNNNKFIKMLLFIDDKVVFPVFEMILHPKTQLGIITYFVDGEERNLSWTIGKLRKSLFQIMRLNAVPNSQEKIIDFLLYEEFKHHYFELKSKFAKPFTLKEEDEVYESIVVLLEYFRIIMLSRYTFHHIVDSLYIDKSIIQTQYYTVVYFQFYFGSNAKIIWSIKKSADEKQWTSQFINNFF